MADTEWESKAANLLKAELKRAGIRAACRSHRRQRAERAEQAVSGQVLSGLHAQVFGGSRRERASALGLGIDRRHLNFRRGVAVRRYL